jgi:outer membrane protein OmpA-like peptidoglycan-associated protein
MKTQLFLTVLLLMLTSGLAIAQESGGSTEPEKVYTFNVAYAHRGEQLLLSDSDFFGCFVFDKKPDTSLIITDVKTFSNEDDFSSPDLIRNDQSVFLNKGEKAGLRKGQRFLISYQTKASFQEHFLVIRKGIGEIVNLYGDTAELKVGDLYNPVEIGDYLTEYKEEAPVSKLKVAYENCVIPQDADTAKVYLPDLEEFGRTILGPEQFVGIEMGKDKVAVGDYLVFFRHIKSHLPPVILGTGVVVVAGDSLSTAKVIDCSSPVVTGAEVAILPEPKGLEGAAAGEIPIVRRVSDTQGVETGEEMLTVEIPFVIDSFLIDEGQAEQFVKIKGFIEGKQVYSILLKGYCCSIGSEEKNLELSQKRVESVKRMLLEQLMVPESQIESAYYGEKEAPYDNSSEAERRKNRLVMVVVVGK